MVELETVRNLESALLAKRKEVAEKLLTRRHALNLSLRDAGKRVRLTAVALNNIERGKSWKTKTVERIARVYERLAA